MSKFIEKSIKVFYWDGMKNFGDALNPLISKKIFNVPIEISEPKSCEAVFIGSLLDDFLYKGVFPWYKLSKRYSKEPLKIWGTGFINDSNKYVKRHFNLKETYFRTAEVFAVRGLYSKRRLEKILNKSLNDVTIGDPGLLASMLVDSSNIEKKYDIGFIPHHLEIHGYKQEENIEQEIEGVIPESQHLDFPIYRELKNQCKNAIIIDMEANPIEIIKRVAECKTIVSSALHGLILSDSLNIPNIWSKASNLLIGNDYKFKDYYSAFDEKMVPKCVNLYDLEINMKDFPRYIIQNYSIEASKVNNIKQKLINSFPYRKGL